MCILIFAKKLGVEFCKYQFSLLEEILEQKGIKFHNFVSVLFSYTMFRLQSGLEISLKVIVDMDHLSKTKELLKRFKCMVQCKCKELANGKFYDY